MSKMSIGKKCALIAKSKNINQADLARTVGISRISVNRFFNDHTNLRVQEFTAIMRVLGYDLDAELSHILMEAATEANSQPLPQQQAGAMS